MKLKKCTIILNSLLLLFLCSQTVNAVKNWKKIADNFYVDTNSIEKSSDKYTTGYFKQTNPTEKIKGKQVSYTKIWTGAFCDIEMQGGIRKLEYPIYWFYDKNNKLIAEDDIHKYWRKHYPEGHLGIMHPEDDDYGELYFNTLCGFM